MINLEELAFLLCSQDRGPENAKAIRANKFGAWIMYLERAREVMDLIERMELEP